MQFAYFGLKNNCGHCMREDGLDLDTVAVVVFCDDKSFYCFKCEQIYHGYQTTKEYKEYDQNVYM